MLRHGGSQPRKEEGALHLARRVKNAEAFLKSLTRYTPAMQGREDLQQQLGNAAAAGLRLQAAAGRMRLSRPDINRLRQFPGGSEASIF